MDVCDLMEKNTSPALRRVFLATFVVTRSLLMAGITFMSPAGELALN